MWDKREKVLAVIVFAVLYCKVALVTAKQMDMAPDAVDDQYTQCRECHNQLQVALVTAKQMDMAPDAVDDQYTQCRDKVLEKVVVAGLLEDELSHSEEFKKVWHANTKCSALIPGGVKEHTAALLTFANGGRNFRKTFNDAVETLGGNARVYHSNFHFKSLHFLLMDSMKLLNKGKCQTVYRISHKNYTAQNSSEVRFGRFALVHSDVLEEKLSDGGVLFNITSCSVLNLEGYTCQQELEFEQLLSPAEVFTVEEIKEIKDDYVYTKITLKHSKLLSYNDCYLFPRSSTGSSTQWPGSIFLVLMALSLFLFTC